MYSRFNIYIESDLIHRGSGGYRSVLCLLRSRAVPHANGILSVRNTEYAQGKPVPAERLFKKMGL